MFLKKIVQMSVFAFILSVSINAAAYSDQRQYQTEFTPVIPLPPVSNTAYSKICTGGVMIQEMSLTTNTRRNGMGGGYIDYLVNYNATTRLAYNDPTGVNNDVCRAIPLNAKLVFLTTKLTIFDGSSSTGVSPRNSADSKAVSDASTLQISGNLRYTTTKTVLSFCLKTSHLSNSGGVVLLKPRRICERGIF